VLSDGIFVNSTEIYFKDSSGKEKIWKRTPQGIFLFGLINMRCKICRRHVMNRSTDFVWNNFGFRRVKHRGI
jgi:hypothetical protein